MRRGRADRTPNAGPQAHWQLVLRHQLAAYTATTHSRAGFTVVLQGVILAPTDIVAG